MIDRLCHAVVVTVCGDVFCQILERRVCVAHRDRHADRAEHFRVVVAVADGDHFSGRHAEQLAQAEAKLEEARRLKAEAEAAMSASKQEGTDGE